MENELKPCPFCGGNELAILKIGSGSSTFFRVVCHEESKDHSFWHRHIEGPLRATKKGAIAAWNLQKATE